MLGHAGLRRIFTNHSDVGPADDDDDDGTYGLGTRRRRRTKRSKYELSPIPSEEGTRLMRSGTFGCTDYYQDILRRRNRRLATRLMNREMGIERSYSTSQDKIIAQVCGRRSWSVSRFQLICDRVSYHQQRQTLSSTITRAVIRASSQMTAIFSFHVHRTLRFGCTTLRIRTVGNIIRQSSILTDNGRLPMHRLVQIINCWRTVPLDLQYV